ncbi:MAG: galactose-1-epimerase [Paludibacteraceae bacterium]|nr:galactose-1-epimerase [Paludibacteraceae bacterium]
MKKLLFFACALLVLGSCQPQLNKAGLDARKFKDTVNGKQTALYTLTNQSGMEVSITNFGGRIVSILVPDRDGNMRDVVLGFDNIKDYETVPTDFGACIGRYANRINHGMISIDGTQYQLLTNNYGHTLHGGPTGWQYQVYDAEQTADNVLRLTIVSPDGDNGFPGEVTAECVYTLRDDNSIEMRYSATTDAPTVINMTNHSYFNLHGDGNKSILDHQLWLNAKQMTPVDSTFMTTGEIEDIVPGTPFDFYTEAKPIGRDIEADNLQLRNGHGYDHNWVLLPNETTPLSLAATLYCDQTGIGLSVYTSEPGIQVYTGNFLDGTVTGKRGEVYGLRHAVCLETQKYPDSPNKPQWPSPVLQPEEKYTSTTIFCFICK